MPDTIRFKLDGRRLHARRGQTILEAARDNGVYIPHLCAHPKLRPWGSCRVCLVRVNGRLQTACTQPVAAGALVENDTPELRNLRRGLVEMLLVEGNHICPACERSGNCELQAMAYRLGIRVPRFPHRFPLREPDMSHPDIMLERNRCIQCARCVRTSQSLDHKHAYDFLGRGGHRRIALSADRAMPTAAAGTDQAMRVCPVGCLLVKRVGYRVPIGQRRYDTRPIGSELEPTAEQERP